MLEIPKIMEIVLCAKSQIGNSEEGLLLSRSIDI